MSYQEQLASLRAERAELAKAMRAEGLSLRAIADELGVSHPTVIADLGTQAGEAMTPSELADLIPRSVGRGL